MIPIQTLCNKNTIETTNFSHVKDYVFREALYIVLSDLSIRPDRLHNDLIMSSDRVKEKSTRVWMSSAVMDQQCMLPSAASSPDPFDSFITEMPLMMESKSLGQVSNNSTYVTRQAQAILFTRVRYFCASSSQADC